MTNLIEEMKDVFELATLVAGFIKDVRKSVEKEKNDNNKEDIGDSGQLAASGNSSQLAASGNYSKLAASGNYSQLAASGDSGQLAASGYSSQLAASGDYSQLAASGDSGQLAASGDYSKLAASGNSSQLAASGYYSKLASSGDYSQLASSGDYSKLASSGNSSQLAASGDYSKLASSGDYSKLESTGEKSVVSAIGACNVAKAKTGSWITLAEYKEMGGRCEIDFVKTEYVDGKNIKEDVFYTLCDHEFKEYGEFDDIQCAILSHKKNIYKVKNFGEKDASYVIEKDGVFSHGKTIKEARESLIYKVSDRDTSAYKNLTLDSEVTFEEAVKMYRVITGACEAGTKYFVSQLSKVKKKYSITEIINLTDGQYGSDSFKKFFKNK